jgi:DNA repair photolyase
MVEFNLLEERKICYDLSDFKPIRVDARLLKERGVDYPILDQVDRELIAGSEWYKDLFENKALTPVKCYSEVLADANEDLEIHNYTGICPTNVLEVSPSVGSCAVGCQYCLVTDGKHVKGIQLYSNYPEKLSNSLELNKDKAIFYYFSPKTEAFSETHLFNGLAHNIMRAFIAHFDKHPDSSIRIFIATKAGSDHLEIKNRGESLFDLMSKIPSKIQINGSIGIMSAELRDILEPNAARIDKRLETLIRCRELGIWAESVLAQPLILPYLTKESVTEFMQQLAAAGIKNIKPEFFTAEIRNLVLVAQYINHFDPDKVGEFFYPYLLESNLTHIKQRARMAPDKKVCLEMLTMIRDIAREYGISISICNWVKRELGSAAEWVKTVDAESAQNGYRCLGYQTNLFNNS